MSSHPRPAYDPKVGARLANYRLINTCYVSIPSVNTVMSYSDQHTDDIVQLVNNVFASLQVVGVYKDGKISPLPPT